MPAPSAAVRVFISSTFRDMHAERDLLVKRVFPQLRRICQQRGVYWTEVDLRWGITDEQRAEGRVLPLCLEEIRRCRPFFIGLLGERYGWVPGPGEIPAELLEAQPWIELGERRSVTELEVLHGVLLNERMSGHAYFYFRDPAYAASLAEPERAAFQVEDAASAAKLERLKQRIRVARDAGICHLDEGYRTPEELGGRVLHDFEALLDRLFPPDRVPDVLAQEAARHEAFARGRRLAFVGREDLLHRLDAHADSTGPPLALVGESGCGKSALVAEWVLRWSEGHPDVLVIQHFLGSSPDSADWRSLVRRLLGELKRELAPALEIPTREEALYGALQEGLAQVPVGRRVVLALDALDQLDERDASRRLGWLPREFPTNIRVVLSTQAGESADAVRARGWTCVEVPLFRTGDVAPASRTFFAVFGKTAPEALLRMLEAAPAARNPLYLRALLDELRQFGSHEELAARATSYLAASTLPQLFERILERWDQDYGRDPEAPGLVRRALSLLACARRGLSESELLDLLGADEGPPDRVVHLLFGTTLPLGGTPPGWSTPPLARAFWTPFSLAAEYALSMHSGLLAFGHTHLREAVRQRWLSSPAAEREARTWLARYFWSQGALDRSVDELPGQLTQMDDWTNLVTVLVSPAFFHRAFTTGRQFEWMESLQQARRSARSDTTLSPEGWALEIPDLFEQACAGFGDPEKLAIFGTLGGFLIESGHPEAARRYIEEEARLLAAAERGRSAAATVFLTAANLNDEGRILLDQNDAPGALEVLEHAERVLAPLAEDPEIPRVLGPVLLNKGRALRMVARFVDAKRVLQHALECMKAGFGERSPEAATVLQGLGNACLAAGEAEEAFAWQREALSIRRERLGDDHRDTAMSMGNTANALFALHRYYAGLRLAERAAAYCQRVLGEEHPFTLSVCAARDRLDTDSRRFMAERAPIGLVLLAARSQSAAESVLDPATPEGRRAAARAITNELVGVWDDLFEHESGAPVMVVACPGFEAAVAEALSTDVARRFGDQLLRSVNVPRIVASSPEDAPEALLQNLMTVWEVRDRLVEWVQSRQLTVVMVKPISNSGTRFDRMIPRWMLKHRAERSTGAGDGSPAVVIEAVPFDGREGPLTGRSVDEQKPRLKVMPGAAWKAAGYAPGERDQRVTGTLYLDLARIAALLPRTSAGPSGLDAWAVEPLMRMASSDVAQQDAILQAALTDLVDALPASLIDGPPERGARGFDAADLADIEHLA